MGARSVIGRLFLALALVAAGCSSESPSSDGALRTDDGPNELSDNAPTSGSDADSSIDLAPSQLVGSTVPEPETPAPCDVDDLELWTAQAMAGDPSVAAVIRIRNAGDVRCDADIRRSPALDTQVEPDVWLERGGTADLIVSPATSGCTEPTVEPAVDVWIGDDVVTVPTVLVTCDWWFTAFYPNDPVRSACERDALELAVALDAVVVRNRSALSCGLADIVEVDGAAVAEGRTAGPMVSELMPGDVVAFGRRSGNGCDGTTRVELYDEVVGLLVFDDVPCDLVFELGGPRVWFGSGHDDPLNALLPFDSET